MLNIDFNNYISSYFGSFFDKPILKAFSNGIIKPLKDLFTIDFPAVKAEITLLLSTNISTADLLNYLQVNWVPTLGYNFHILDNFDNYPSSMDKYIGEPIKSLNDFDFNLNETVPTGQQSYTWNLNERNPMPQYTVIVPVEFSTNIADITAALNMWRPAGKQFNITIQNI